MINLIYYLQKKTQSFTFPVIRMTLILAIMLISLFSVSCSDEPVDPKLTTLEALDTDITSTAAILKGEITVAGTKKIIEYGIELSDDQLFTSPQTESITGFPDVGVFQVQFTDLQPNTLYYYKAYVLINTARVYSENREQFTTKQ